MKASAVRKRKLLAARQGEPPYEKERDQAAIRWLERRGRSLSPQICRRLSYVIRNALRGSALSQSMPLPRRKDSLNPNDPALLRTAYRWMRDRWEPEHDMIVLDSDSALQEVFIQGLWLRLRAKSAPERRKDLERNFLQSLLEFAQSAESGISEADRQRLKLLRSAHFKYAESAALIKTPTGRAALEFERALQTAKSKRDKAAILMRFCEDLKNNPDFCSELPIAIRFLNNPPTAKAWLVEYSILQGSEGKYTRSEVQKILGITGRGLRKICRELQNNHNAVVPFKAIRPTGT